MKKNSISIACLYGLLHMCVEIICFYMISWAFPRLEGTTIYIWAFLYDFLAFVPQFIFGYIYDRRKDWKIEYVAVLMLILSLVFTNKVIVMLLFALANAILHETAAVATTSVSGGKLSHSAIYVGGGSFGVVIGQTMGTLGASKWYMLIFIAVILVVLLLTRNSIKPENREYPEFDLIKEGISPKNLVLLVLIIVAVRSFLAYAIPISWKKELWQSFLLFFTMGLGKMLGGIFSDLWGARKVGIITTLVCIPFLVLGDNVMLLSIMGVFLFSMTMPITFGMLLSKFRHNSGLSFGVTTIGLFLGVMPVLFFGSFPLAVNLTMIVVMSITCSYAFYKTLK